MANLACYGGCRSSGLVRKSWEKLRTRSAAVLAEQYSTYDFTSFPAAFRTFAQRSLCAAAIRLRASLLKVRPVFLSFFPPAWPSASSAFPTCPISFSRREYSFFRETTTLFIIIEYPLCHTANTTRHSIETSR